MLRILLALLLLCSPLHAQSLGPITPSAVGVAAIGQIPGTATNDSASAGNVGEYVSSSVVFGSAVSLTTSTAANITSISLTAGDWDISALGYFNAGATTNINLAEVSISTTSATRNNATVGAFTQLAYGNPSGLVLGGSGVISESIPTFRVSIATPTTYFFVGYSVFTVSTNTAYGMIHARRVR